MAGKNKLFVDICRKNEFFFGIFRFRDERIRFFVEKLDNLLTVLDLAFPILTVPIETFTLWSPQVM